MEPRILPLPPARAVLVALVALVPLVFWRGLLEPFECCKVALLYLGALLLLGRFLAAPAWPGRGLWRDPLALAMLASFASAALSTAFSVSPRTSFWGAWQSHQGLLTAA